LSRYVAFLRGVNVGGKTVKMDALRKVFESLGYTNVSTLLASGNVIFESKGSNEKKLKAEIEAAIKKTFAMDVHIIIRSEKELAALVKSDPFNGVIMKPQTRLYITFLSQAPDSKLKTPYKSIRGGYLIRKITDSHVVSILGPKVSSPDVMDFLDKEFGKEITTRNWNTILKISKVME
jgi:uncharacterized protein (DUF1697 family)